MRNRHLPALLLTLSLPASALFAATPAPPGGGPGKAPAAPAKPTTPTIRFSELDADRDGRITRQEWKGNDVSFAQQDTNSDGVLSGAEIAVAPSAPPSGNPGGSQPQAGVHDRSRLERLFRKLDANRDGRLTTTELKAENKFERLDRNRDRIVSRDEFLKQ